MVMEAGTDLVDPGMFLRGCKEPLEQYRECLMKNLKDWDERYGTVVSRSCAKPGITLLQCVCDSGSPIALQRAQLSLQSASCTAVAGFMFVYVQQSRLRRHGFSVSNFAVWSTLINSSRDQFNLYLT